MNDNVLRYTIASLLGISIAMAIGFVVSHFVNQYFTLLAAVLAGRISFAIENEIIRRIQKRQKESQDS